MMLSYVDEASHKEMCKYADLGRKSYDATPPFFGVTSIQNVRKVPPKIYPEHHLYTALMPLGHYEGGYVVLPQLKMKIE